MIERRIVGRGVNGMRALVVFYRRRQAAESPSCEYIGELPSANTLVDGCGVLQQKIHSFFFLGCPRAKTCFPVSFNKYHKTMMSCALFCHVANVYLTHRSFHLRVHIKIVIHWSGPLMLGPMWSGSGIGPTLLV